MWCHTVYMGCPLASINFNLIICIIFHPFVSIFNFNFMSKNVHKTCIADRKYFFKWTVWPGYPLALNLKIWCTDIIIRISKHCLVQKVPLNRLRNSSGPVQLQLISPESFYYYLPVSVWAFQATDFWCYEIFPKVFYLVIYLFLISHCPYRPLFVKTDEIHSLASHFSTRWIPVPTQSHNIQDKNITPHIICIQNIIYCLALVEESKKKEQERILVK